MGPLPDAESNSPVPNGIKVIVLGTAQDAGIPQLGCRCLHCRLALEDANATRRVVSLGVINPESGEVLVIDAGPDIRFQLGRLMQDPHVALHGMRKPVDAIFLTHAHAGHYSGLLQLGFESANSETIPVFATDSMLSFLKSNQPFASLFERGNLVGRPIVPGDWVTLAPRLRIRSFNVLHRDELSDTVGFVIEGAQKTLLYIPDINSWEGWSESIVEWVGSVDFALLDGTFYSRKELPDRNLEDIPHPTIENTIALLREVVARGSVQVYFTHLNHSNPAHRRDSPERKAVEDAGFHVAEDDMVFWL